MTPEEYYKQENYPVLDKFDKKATKFDYYDVIQFAEEYAEQLKLNVVGVSTCCNNPKENHGSTNLNIKSKTIIKMEVVVKFLIRIIVSLVQIVVVTYMLPFIILGLITDKCKKYEWYKKLYILFT